MCRHFCSTCFAFPGAATSPPTAIRRHLDHKILSSATADCFCRWLGWVNPVITIAIATNHFSRMRYIIAYISDANVLKQVWNKSETNRSHDSFFYRHIERYQMHIIIIILITIVFHGCVIGLFGIFSAFEISKKITSFH